MFISKRLFSNRNFLFHSTKMSSFHFHVAEHKNETSLKCFQGNFTRNFENTLFSKVDTLNS